MAALCLSARAQQPAAAPALAHPAPTPTAAAVPKPTPEAEEARTKAPNDAAHQGIKVHGHGKLVAKNLDGNVAKTLEFENSLVRNGQGDLLLAGLITGQITIAEWSVRLIGYTGLCSTTCILLNSRASSDPLGMACTLTGYVCFGGMTTVYQPRINSINSGMVLSGSFTAASAGSISNVSTLPVGCASDTAIGTLSGSTPYVPTLANFTAASCLTPPQPGARAFESILVYFTGQNLTSPFTFSSGQIVQVTVTISFS